MNCYFDKVKNYLLEMGCEIRMANEAEGLFVVNHQERGLHNLVIGCAEPLLILEQFIFEIREESPEVYRSLLQKNRDMIAGAFVLDESGRKVLYRNTLQLENLDLNEVEGTFNALSLLLSEYSEELIRFARQ
ncbi:YbjN domain-containing protein [Cesiribacter andamanensis]|uniref:Tir chaperone protein (CesT) n=1 Tax=Cesiribacter andamanensis AMV16 TaxID=1279009 RepID=M7NJU4_9BACT|nr:YbjN domain-containing protein [Cesiribacter andamanensis]EMR02065.1 hypothetical protein ADICEAN_02811 [Cesiribacter andamanensis AMV16]